MNKKHSGYCALCLEYKDKLTFEHIPPRSSGNNSRAKIYNGQELIGSNKLPWDFSEMHYENAQQGAGKYSLCKKCNNKTGRWYGAAYSQFAQQIKETFETRFSHLIQTGEINIKNVYPLQVIKQIFSMFCSANPPTDDHTNYKPVVYPFSTQILTSPIQKLILAQYNLVNAEYWIDDLRKVVLDKERTGLNYGRFKICMYFTLSPLLKINGISESLNLNHHDPVSVSEIVTYPVGFLLILNPNNAISYPGIDITHWADYAYTDCTSISLPLCMYPVNSWIPIDFRSREEIQKCIEANKSFLG